MSRSVDLIAWMRQQVDDDERKIAAMEREERRVQTAPIFQGHPPNWLAGVDIFVSPKRWRAEVEAKRRILDELAMWLDGHYEERAHEFVGTTSRVAALLTAVHLLAQPYADRPGWREEWRA